MNRVLFFIAFIFSTAARASPLCGAAGENLAYQALRRDLGTRIESFANSQSIAAQADAVLSKMLTAKSPVIQSWIDKRGLQNKSEKEILRAWRLYYAQNLILNKYPHRDRKIDELIEKLVDESIALHLNRQFKDRMEKLFRTAQKSAIETLQEMKLEKGAAITARVKSIRLYFPEQLKSARNNAVPLDIIAWGIAYDPVPNQINVGLQALSHMSDASYLAVFAHEIGHSFDSCRWGAFFDGKWPFDTVGTCLRSAQSVAAKRRDDSELESFLKNGKISKELALGLKNNPTCNRAIYPPPGKQADQLPEAFADWFSAEVVSRIKGIDLTTMRSDLCREKALSEGSSYPANHLRLNRIYALHPKIKERLDALSAQSAQAAQPAQSAQAAQSAQRTQPAQSGKAQESTSGVYCSWR